MITDIFFRRYEQVPLWTSFRESERRFLGQAAQLITDELFARNEKSYKNRDNDPACKGLELCFKIVERELGVTELTPRRWVREVNFGGNNRREAIAYMVERRVLNYLTKQPEENHPANLFMKRRMSFVEVAFQVRRRQLADRKASLIASLGEPDTPGDQLYEAMGDDHVWASTKKALVADEAAFAEQITELNVRLRQAQMPLSYHNDLIQLSDDALFETEVERPFWDLVAAPKWSVVDAQMKEALDERDRGERNAVSNALNALESTIKTISDDKGWTRGTERGAAHYIDNLVPEREGARFIAVWEKDMLVALFREMRNQFGHGPAAGQPLPALRAEQSGWAIDACMAWIKSLVRRL
jgi:hypothetical protein